MQWDLTSLNETDVIYFYGWNESICDAFQPWLRLNPSRRLIVLEDTFSTYEAVSALGNTQIRSHYLGGAAEEELKMVVWEHFGRTSSFLYGPKKSQAKVDALQRCLEDLQRGVELTFSYYQDFGAPFMRNAFANLQNLKGVKKGDALEGKFQGIPAIICGAGPSLDRQLTALPFLDQKALIFGAGSALIPLLKGGVMPHFGVLIDPETPLSHFFKETALTFPIFYQLQLNAKCLRQIKGEKLLFGKGEGLSLLDWFLEEIGLELPRFAPGWNVATFATHIAYTLGCDPIIFVGMDGCTQDQTVYASGVYSGRDREHKDPRNSVSCIDRFGNQVFSRSDFLMGKKWLEALAGVDPKRYFVNATERGLTFEGIPNLSLKEVSQKFLTHSSDLRSQVNQAIERIEVLPHLQVKPTIHRLSSSAKRCLEIVAVFIERGAESLLDSIALDEEPFYQELFAFLWEVWKYPLQNQREMEDPKIEKMIQKMLFLKKVASHYQREVIDG